ncbi:unnamed protein product, partial [Nesidiocoris tenuis]
MSMSDPHTLTIMNAKSITELERGSIYCYIVCASWRCEEESKEGPWSGEIHKPHSSYILKSPVRKGQSRSWFSQTERREDSVARSRHGRPSSRSNDRNIPPPPLPFQRKYFRLHLRMSRQSENFATKLRLQDLWQHNKISTIPLVHIILVIHNILGRPNSLNCFKHTQQPLNARSCQSPDSTLRAREAGRLTLFAFPFDLQTSGKIWKLRPCVEKLENWTWMRPWGKPWTSIGVDYREPTLYGARGYPDDNFLSRYPISPKSRSASSPEPNLASMIRITDRKLSTHTRNLETTSSFDSFRALHEILRSTSSIETIKPSYMSARNTSTPLVILGKIRRISDNFYRVSINTINTIKTQKSSLPNIRSNSNAISDDSAKHRILVAIYRQWRMKPGSVKLCNGTVTGVRYQWFDTGSQSQSTI